MNRAERAKIELQRQKVKLARRKREADAQAAKEKEAENQARLKDERGKLMDVERAMREALGLS